jgi:hypothetical protein
MLFSSSSCVSHSIGCDSSCANDSVYGQLRLWQQAIQLRQQSHQQRLSQQQQQQQLKPRPLFVSTWPVAPFSDLGAFHHSSFYEIQNFVEKKTFIICSSIF